jgi:hypothetical protein
MSDARLQSLVKCCKNRGGACPCVGSCHALNELNREIERLRSEWFALDAKLTSLEEQRSRLQSPITELKPGFVFESGMAPVVHLDDDDSVWGYEDSDGNFHEREGWPFTGRVYADDCERLGFKVV